MFKKVKRHNGIREIYLGKKKIFNYINNASFAEFVEAKFSQAEHDIDIIATYIWGKKRPC